jgi:hypothetical protein
MGQWLWDPGFGWTFASYQPWGWAPYHYGGWLFDTSCGGWFYSPPAYYGFGGHAGFVGNPRKRVPPIVHPPRPVYRASTAVFVRQNGKLGVVPMNPLDKPGKTALNLEHGVFSAEPTRSAAPPILSTAGGQKWETLKSPPRDALSSGLVATTPPVRTSRTILEGSSGARIDSHSANSSIVYDPHEHRFVNTNSAPPTVGGSTAVLTERNTPGVVNNDRIKEGGRNTPPRGTSMRVPVAPSSARASAPPPRSIAPPPAPRSSSSGGSYRGGGTVFSGGGGGGSSRGSSAPATPAPRVSAPSGGGGRPH